MKSITKYDITKEQIRKVFAASGIGKVSDIREISDGWYNSVFSVADQNGRKYVLKVAPQKSVKILSHEKNIMASEVKFYRMLHENTAIKTPEIVHEDFSDTIIPTAYFIMEFLNGDRLDQAELSKTESIEANKQWAWILSEFHKIKGAGYGYEQTGLFPTWKEALTSMTKMLIEDATGFGKKCRIGKKLLRYIERFSKELIDVPCVLINFDLHALNLFCKRTSEGNLELAVLDLERCFWGDPIGDFIMPEMMKKDFRKKKVFIEYNRLAAKPLQGSRNERIRYHLLAAYLAVIMYTERFSRFRSLKRYYNPIFLAGTVGSKILAANAFSALKKLSMDGCN